MTDSSALAALHPSHGGLGLADAGRSLEPARGAHGDERPSLATAPDSDRGTRRPGDVATGRRPLRRRPPGVRDRPVVRETVVAMRRRHEALIQELRLAEEVQRSMLPRTLPSLPWVRFGSALRPCLHLAGDFFNVVRLDRDRVGMYLGDVMGHGPAAALLGVFTMHRVQTKRIEGNNYELLGPAEVLSNLNQDLIRADFPGRPFVTMVYGVLDSVRRTLTYGVGGHPPVLLLRPDQPPRRLEGGGLLLGVFESEFEEQVLPLLPGDRLAFYSDGAESTCWGDHGPGVDGLASVLSSRRGHSPQELVDHAMSIASGRQRPGRRP